MRNNTWICRETLYYRNTDPDQDAREWTFTNEEDAKARFLERKKVYLSKEDDNDWIEINTRSNYLCMFYNECAGGNIVITYYCRGYNGNPEKLK